MGICADNCIDDTLIAYPQASCAADIRLTTPSRIFFFMCSTTLPNPITNQNIAALFDSGEIVASMPLGNIEWGDVQYEDVILDDCQTPRRIPSSREATFEDRYGVADTNSPSTGLYLDYDFWINKVEKQQNLNYMVAYCNGDVKVARKQGSATQLLTASITVQLGYQRPQNAGNASIEFKQIAMNFAGDPLDLRNKPEFNYIEAGITL